MQSVGRIFCFTHSFSFLFLRNMSKKEFFISGMHAGAQGIVISNQKRKKIKESALFGKRSKRPANPKRTGSKFSIITKQGCRIYGVLRVQYILPDALINSCICRDSHAL